jgi:hypothetical protein
MNKIQMLEAFRLIDIKLKKPIKWLLGGGGAMLLAYQFPVSTQDIDAVIYKSDLSLVDIQDDVQAVAQELNLPGDWLNSYFEVFLYTLPSDYETRLKNVFTGMYVTVNALGLEDLLILKCFAGREKDIGHARALIRKGVDIGFVQNHIRKLIDARIPKAQDASDFLDDLLDE